jgi:processive 1,2-diacylglycerol beta-glucosyltransferase
MTSPRLLLLTASTGNGHLSANRALAVEAEAEGLAIHEADVMLHCHHLFRAWFAGGYERTVRNSPAFWGHLYRRSDRPYFYYRFQTMLDHNFCGGIRHILEASRPDWVVCTHSVAQPRLEDFRREFGFRIAVVITDIHPHAMWLRGEPDYFFAPTQETYDRLRARNPAFADRCEVVGMPINQAFVQAAANRPPAGPRPRVLVTAGGIGSGPLLEVARALEKLDVEADVVAGRGADNEKRLRAAFPNHPRIRVHGLVPQEGMAKLMAAADLLVAKSGGLTTFEALTCGTPFVVFEPLLIPGQEEDNARFLKQIGAGETCANLDALIRTVSDLAADPARRAQMREAALAHARPDAARRIIQRIREL